MSQAENARLPGEEASASYWDIVRRQFARNRPAMVALWCVIGLVVSAIMAPLVAMNIPYVLVTETGGWEFPLAERLFDRFVFASSVDVFFNLLLVLLPLWLLGAGLGRALFAPHGTRRGRKAAWFAGGLAFFTALYLIFMTGERDLFDRLLPIGLLGVALQLLQAWRGSSMVARHRRRVANQTRVLLTLGLMATLWFTFSEWSGTREVTEYRKVIKAIGESGEGWAIGPPVFYHYSNVGDNEVSDRMRLKPPNWENRNLLGTDNKSRDIFSRLLFGTRISLTIGLIAVSIYATIGIILGSLAGFFGGWVDMAITAMLQIMLCIPSLFLLLTIMAVFETRSIFLIMLAIGLVSWTGITRLVRGEFFRQKSIDYVVAAKALGIPQRRIIFGHILKNAMAPVLVAAAFGVAGAILIESFIAFVGLGDANAPSWGQILQEGRKAGKMWLILSPGMAIFFVVTVLNLVGDGLRDALDPKLRQ